MDDDIRLNKSAYTDADALDTRKKDHAFLTRRSRTTPSTPTTWSMWMGPSVCSGQRRRQPEPIVPMETRARMACTSYW
eukprot:9448836-Heterocapsa_arctica.AAC.2